MHLESDDDLDHSAIKEINDALYKIRKGKINRIKWKIREKFCSL
jgi:hypothetical protein